MSAGRCWPAASRPRWTTASPAARPGGLVRAYTDSVAQALLQAEKVPLVRTRSLRCSVPYALEGLLRREIAAAGAPLLDVAHAALVTLQWSLPEPEAEAFVARINDLCQGRAGWLDAQ